MLDKIKAMREMAEKMAEMEKNVLNEVKKDRKQLRYDALCKIFDYLDEVADSLNGEKVRIELNKRQLFSFEDYIYINFNSQYTTYRHGWESIKSENIIKWHIESSNGKKDKGWHRYYFIDRGELDELCINGNWLDGYIKLLENWQDVKCQIESGITKYYEDKMKRMRENAQKNLESYEKAANFEV